jgi:hypothetical protein
VFVSLLSGRYSRPTFFLREQDLQHRAVGLVTRHTHHIRADPRSTRGRSRPACTGGLWRRIGSRLTRDERPPPMVEIGGGLAV